MGQTSNSISSFSPAERVVSTIVRNPPLCGLSSRQLSLGEGVVLPSLGRFGQCHECKSWILVLTLLRRKCRSLAVASAVSMGGVALVPKLDNQTGGLVLLNCRAATVDHCCEGISHIVALVYKRIVFAAPRPDLLSLVTSSIRMKTSPIVEIFL